MSASQSQPEPQSPSTARDRRLKLDNTLIPAIAALMGALIGGVVTVIITLYQINANQHQSADDFLRSQRQIAYTALLTDANELRYDWFYYNLKQSTTLASNITALITKLGGDYSEIALVGPSNIADASYGVFTDASEMGAEDHLGINTLSPSQKNSAAGFFSAFVNDLSKLNYEMSQVIGNS